jgi:hypothetical protein
LIGKADLEEDYFELDRDNSKIVFCFVGRQRKVFRMARVPWDQLRLQERTAVGGASGASG